MSTQAGAMPDSYPVHWAGQLAILALPQHVGDCNAGQIREQLLWVINRGAAEPIIDMTGTASCEIPSEAPGDRWLIRLERAPRVVLVHRPRTADRR